MKNSALTGAGWTISTEGSSWQHCKCLRSPASWDKYLEKGECCHWRIWNKALTGAVPIVANPFAQRGKCAEGQHNKRPCLADELIRYLMEKKTHTHSGTFSPHTHKHTPTHNNCTIVKCTSCQHCIGPTNESRNEAGPMYLRHSYLHFLLTLVRIKKKRVERISMPLDLCMRGI